MAAENLISAPKMPLIAGGVGPADCAIAVTMALAKLSRWAIFAYINIESRHPRREHAGIDCRRKIP
jgi:hypothetical protein